jgi:hypothetical protein
LFLARKRETNKAKKSWLAKKHINFKVVKFLNIKNQNLLWKKSQQ